MPKIIPKLTTADLRAALRGDLRRFTKEGEEYTVDLRPGPKEKILAAGDGLYLTVGPAPHGRRTWELRCVHEGRRLKFKLGDHSASFGLTEAQTKADKVRAGLARQDDMATIRGKKATVTAPPTAPTFQAVAEQWLEVHAKAKTLSDTTKEKKWGFLSRAVLPYIGTRPVDAITMQEMDSSVFDRIKKQERTDKAHRVFWICRSVFKYAIRKGLRKDDPTYTLEEDLPAVRIGHHAAITDDPEKVGQLLRDIDAYQGWYATKAGLQLLPLLFVRPGELRLARWSEFDLDGALWEIPAERMKGRITKKRPHLVPLSRQVVAILRELQALTGGSTYLFSTPRQKDKPVSNMAFLNGLRRMGYDGSEQTAHGFRAIFNTMARERLGIPHEVIEAQMAHEVKDPNRGAYNRALYLEQRTAMMQAWADYMDALKTPPVEVKTLGVQARPQGRPRTTTTPKGKRGEV